MQATGTSDSWVLVSSMKTDVRTPHSKSDVSHQPWHLRETQGSTLIASVVNGGGQSHLTLDDESEFNNALALGSGLTPLEKWWQALSSEVHQLSTESYAQ